jgi:hypothetical protein
VHALDELPRAMRSAVEEVLEPGEEIVGVWATRGIGANALVCAPTRALISKRVGLRRWSVHAFPYTDIDSVEMVQGRPGAAVQVALVPVKSGEPREPGPFDDFPDAYFQESRALLAPNTLMLRNRRTAREAVEALQGLIGDDPRA